jgi:DNA-binding transcriptional ArsR family regulator
MPPADPEPQDPGTGAVAAAQQASDDASRTAMDAASKAGVPVPDVPGTPPAPSPDEAEREAERASASAARLASKLREEAAAALQTILGAFPSDPLGALGQQVDPVRREAEQLLDGDDGSSPDSSIETNQVAAATQAPIDSALLVAGGLVVAGTATAVLVSFWVAGSSGVTGASGTGAAGKSALDLRRLLPLASPLFTRFEKGTVLGHPKREALYALILQEPGISLQALGERLNLSRTAVTHHLRLMEHQHVVVSRRVGRGRHYYENGGRYGHDQKEAYALLRNERSRAVAAYVRDHPGAIQREVCEALGLGASIAHWHVERLREARLVDVVRRGRTVAYYPGPTLNEVLTPQVTALAAAQPAAPPPAPAPAPAPSPSPLAAPALAAAAMFIPPLPL